MKANHKTFDWYSFINNHPLFGELASDDINGLLDPNNSTPRTFKQDSVIFRSGEISNSFFLIGEGSVNVELASEDSSATNISILYKGDYFGEMSAIDNQYGRAATISAIEKCTLLEIKSRPFQQILKTNPELEFKLLSMLSARLRHVNDHLLKSTRLTYDTKFSLLSEKIESQSKVVDASLRASQSVFEQTKIRTDEIIHSAERGRTRVTWAMSTLTAGFTLLLMLFGFFGIKNLATIETIKQGIEEKKTAIEKTVDEIENTRQAVGDMKIEFYAALKHVNETIKSIDGFMEATTNSISDSETAKRILFESLISLFMTRVEEFINLKVEHGESDAIVDPGNLGVHILEIKDPDITIKLFLNLFYEIEESHNDLADNLTKISESSFESKSESELKKENMLNRERMDYFEIFMGTFIITGDDEPEADNPLAVFLSHYILLVTDMMPSESDTMSGKSIELNSVSFEIQSKELKTKYKKITTDDTRKKLYEDFISALDDSEVYIARIKAVNNAISMH